MTTIWKFPIALLERQVIQMPKGAHPLSVQMQGNTITLWAMVNTEHPMEDREIRIVGTGREADSRDHYLGTVQVDGFIWHIFEHYEKPKKK